MVHTEKHLLRWIGRLEVRTTAQNLLPGVLGRLATSPVPTVQSERDRFLAQGVFNDLISQ